MNNVSLKELEEEKINKLKKYQLDIDSINEFKSNIKHVSEEESNKLGKELFDLIFKTSFYDKFDDYKVKNLIYNGANIEYKEEKKGLFPLLICVRKNYFKTFLLLLRAGASVNQVNKYLTTPTMDSARWGNKEILEILILMGSDINAWCQDYDTALISAVRHHKNDCIDVLVRNQVYLNHRNLRNESILDVDQSLDFSYLTIHDKSLISKDPYELIDRATKVLDDDMELSDKEESSPSNVKQKSRKKV